MQVSFPFSRRQCRGFSFLLSILILLGSGFQCWNYFRAIPPETLSFTKFPIFPASRIIPCLEINQASVAQWDSLPGIGPKLSKRIVRFRKSKGGFHSTSELQKVYGLPPNTFASISPYLHLEKRPERNQRSKTRYRNNHANRRYYREKRKAIVDLNLADSLQLEALPGIGPKLAVRILKYRNILGYFYHVDQLRAVYGLSEENFHRMRPFLRASLPDSLSLPSLNTASRWQIQRLAFWDKPLADSLLSTRRKIGRFVEWKEISALPFVPERGMEELQAYFVLAVSKGK